jgi:hypothetical protein
MAGECVRYKCGGVMRSGPIAAVSKGVATRIGEEVGEVAGGGWDELPTLDLLLHRHL